MKMNQTHVVPNSLTIIILIVTIIIIVIVPEIQCKSKSHKHASKNTTIIEEQRTKPPKPPIFIDGYFGGGVYKIVTNQLTNLHWLHGSVQEANQDYYQNYQHKSTNNQSLDYYFGYGLSLITDNDNHYNYVNYYFNNRKSINDKREFLQLMDIWKCHPSINSLCLENTESVCLTNGTIYCLSLIKFVTPCMDVVGKVCINTTVPTVPGVPTIPTNGSIGDVLENIQLPCLTTIKLIDPFIDKHGMTINRVGNSFILVPALEEEKRVYCLIAIIDPVRN